MKNQRSQQLEWIDLETPYYTDEEYRDYLYQLDRIGRFLGGDQATYWALKQLPFYPSSILDVGCGGGLFTMRLAARYPEATVMGSDISQQAIDFAHEHLQKCRTELPHVQFFVPSSPQLETIPFQVDVVMATLVCHHLSDQELVSFLQQAYRIAKKAVIINDLHRHPLAKAGFATLVPLLFRNRFIWHDGLLSIDRGFKYQEWCDYLQVAGIQKEYWKISWHWAFRWIVIIRKDR